MRFVGAAQPKYTDGVKGDLTTAHPAIMPDGSMVNFTRTLPFGGFNLFRQDPVTLARTQVGG
jgi:carlactone synthase/all-trans-10'-apo-beta-carotenal 13,14-cleaving dioxygenase